MIWKRWNPYEYIYRTRWVFDRMICISRDHFTHQYWTSPQDESNTDEWNGKDWYRSSCQTRILVLYLSDIHTITNLILNIKYYPHSIPLDFRIESRITRALMHQQNRPVCALLSTDLVTSQAYSSATTHWILKIFTLKWTSDHLGYEFNIQR